MTTEEEIIHSRSYAIKQISAILKIFRSFASSLEWLILVNVEKLLIDIAV